MKKTLKYLFLGLLALIIGYCGLNFHIDIPLAELKQKYANAESEFIEIDGLQVHYRDEGNPNDSIPLLLIHGTGASLHTWDGWVAAFEGQHRTIRVDLPAYGLTGPNANNDYSMEAYSQFLKKFLDKINVKRCHLAGNSLGGGIVWNFALRFPEIAQKLILLDAAGYASKNKKGGALAFTIARTPVLNKLMRYITPRAIAEKTLRAAYFDQNKVSDTLIDRYFDMVLREGNREAFVARMTQKWDDNSAQIKTIAKPTLIMWGDHDNIIPVEMADLFTKDLPNDSLIIYKNVGHVPMEEIPTQSAKDALKFLYEK